MGARVTRMDRLTAARNAGLRGEDPGPAWLGDYADDPGVMASYEGGLASFQQNQGKAGGRAPGKTRSDRRRATKTTAPDSSPSPETPPTENNDQPAPRTWSPSSAPVFSAPASVGHDLAGVLVGIVGVAYLINVLHGTGNAWLRAKFLNAGNPVPKPAGQSTSTTPASYPVAPGAQPDWSFLNGSQAFTPTPAASPSQGASS